MKLSLGLTTLRDARRVGALRMTLLQLVAFAALPTADAVLDGAQLDLPLHVESEGNPDCSVHHDHLFCQAVRSLSSATRTTEIGGIAGSAAIVQLEGQAADVDTAARRLLSGSVGPRAPPLS
ncbi:MAG TPA: hypothetical protein VM198_06320 [Longimicrobiales bacterium]|nr:hypothetical protein [Longimicrobiales bacterium]